MKLRIKELAKRDTFHDGYLITTFIFIKIWHIRDFFTSNQVHWPNYQVYPFRYIKIWPKRQGRGNSSLLGKLPKEKYFFLWGMATSLMNFWHVGSFKSESKYDPTIIFVSWLALLHLTNPNRKVVNKEMKNNLKIMERLGVMNRNTYWPISAAPVPPRKRNKRAMLRSFCRIF